MIRDIAGATDRGRQGTVARIAVEEIGDQSLHREKSDATPVHQDQPDEAVTLPLTTETRRAVTLSPISMDDEVLAPAAHAVAQQVVLLGVAAGVGHGLGVGR
ncbi:hypothetical protein BLA60_29695 [Actinophytocola xinjiangensis]|uniref:Uncharacterized protein n=1 Tax=Actinophytocola xinjiangensis TaxID=485602 RepID=A0A7Z0WH07_9PSEU|nr:hypothetical protein [Actinophytocola xinjiangensis]OLF07025.1 hypothetical protein BLA60_29695 [Actinophytocola xinjiangensis]